MRRWRHEDVRINSSQPYYYLKWSNRAGAWTSTPFSHPHVHQLALRAERWVSPLRTIRVSPNFFVIYSVKTLALCGQPNLFGFELPLTELTEILSNLLY
jgi:hypothetical protein